MSKIRGIFPLFFAGGLGIVNALWVFDPEFRQQRENKDRLAREFAEPNAPSNENQAKTESVPVPGPASPSSTTASASASKSNEPSMTKGDANGNGSGQQLTSH